MMKRREFVTLLGGAAVWPLAAMARQDDRVRRVAVLMPGAENGLLAKARLSAFTPRLPNQKAVSRKRRARLIQVVEGFTGRHDQEPIHS